MISIISAYDEKERVQLGPFEKSRTKQAFAEEANVNFILEKFRATGLIEYRETNEDNYGDFAAVDFHAAMNEVTAAQQLFSQVPADIRKRFDNDPGEFLDFVTDEANREELYELGLATPPPEPPVVTVTPPATEPEAAPEPEPSG